MQSVIKLDREKYLSILKTQGLSEAITALHLDMREFEHETFDTHEGYRPEVWQVLEEARKFSRELWNGAAD